MHNQPNSPAISPLRQRLIDDMNLRHFGHETQRNYLRDIGRLASFLARPPDTASVDDLRRFQIWQQSEDVPVPTMNSVVSALKFFFNTTIDRPDLARRLVRLVHPRNLSLFCQIQRMHAVARIQASPALIQRPRVPLIHRPATSHDRPRTHL
ncbi:integrase [Brucella anthropi]|nr:integrase [Brucella anthropi]KAB2776133.1 integrase [Brucella anthropi]MBM6397166.1 phage integrase N-terminal SAM-like domain-containing protein [Brucella anthropi]